jgi:basic membrane protein A
MKPYIKGKIWGFTCIVVLTLILAACGSKSESPSAASDSASPTASDTGKSTATAPATDKKMPRVAFVYIGPPGDGGWTFEHDRGRKYMEEKLGIKADTVENVPESSDAERIITELAQNHDVIFTTSFGYMDQTLNVAKKFPKVVFIHCGGYKTADNMGTYFGENYEASYLAGIAAGKTTKKNLLGYIGAFPIPEVIYNLNAFTLGAQSVNPAVKVKVIWSNTWFDPTVERQAAVSLLDQGADVLLAYQDSPATIQAASERGALAGGNDSDMARYAPDAYLTNPTWNWGPFYTKTVQAVADGTWKSEQYLGSMKDGLVDLAPLGKKVPDDVKALVEEKKKAFIDGTLKVFTGPIKDQSGAVKVAEGKELTIAEILSMNWLVQGVDGTIPK